MSKIVISNPDQFRVNIRSKLMELIHEEKISTNLEIGIFNFAIREANFRSIVKKWDNPLFIQIYTDRLRSIYFNLKSNLTFLEQVKTGELTSQHVAYMTHQEIKPERWREMIERLTKKQDSLFNKKVEASTDMFTCRNYKCKSKRCTYYELQTRSADEPATVFITCLDCGKHWKM